LVTGNFSDQSLGISCAIFQNERLRQASSLCSAPDRATLGGEKSGLSTVVYVEFG
jgi:hypothetical protein